MSSQFEEYPEASNIVILPAKIISQRIKLALPKKAEWTISVLCARQYQDGHQHLQYKGALKEMRVLVQHGSARHPADISQRYENAIRSQHTCAGRSPGYSQGPG